MLDKKFKSRGGVKFTCGIINEELKRGNIKLPEHINSKDTEAVKIWVKKSASELHYTDIFEDRDEEISVILRSINKNTSSIRWKISVWFWLNVVGICIYLIYLLSNS